MTPERARELAIAILFGMVGNNDEIANDPSRWGDPLQSFSFDEVAVKIEEAILQACAEEREACAKMTIDAERYRWEREHPAWETEAFLGGLSPEQYDAAIDKARHE